MAAMTPRIADILMIVSVRCTSAPCRTPMTLIVVSTAMRVMAAAFIPQGGSATNTAEYFVENADASVATAPASMTTKDVQPNRNAMSGPVRLAQIDVNATGIRIRGRQLRQRQRAEQAQRTTDNPDAEHQHRRLHGCRHGGRHDENAGADDRTNQQHVDVEGAKDAWQRRRRGHEGGF